MIISPTSEQSRAQAIREQADSQAREHDRSLRLTWRTDEQRFDDDLAALEMWHSTRDMRSKSR